MTLEEVLIMAYERGLPCEFCGRVHHPRNIYIDCWEEQFLRCEEGLARRVGDVG